MPTRDAPASDEISLVDLAVILVKRWKVLLAVFLLTIFATLAFILLRSASYTYTSVYAVAETLDEEGESIGLVSPKAVLTKLDIMILPRQAHAYLDEKGWSSLPFSIETTLLADTRLITLTTSAAKAQAADVEALHRRVIDALTEEQMSLFERKQASLERRLSNIRRAMRAVGVTTGILAQPASEIEREIDALQKGEARQIAARSLHPQGVGNSLIMALGLVLASMLAVIGVFVAHFATLVRGSLALDLPHKRVDT